MAERTNTSRKQTSKTTNSPPPAHRARQDSQTRPAPERLEDLPAESNAQPARVDAVLRLQRQLGNNYVQRQIARQEEDENKAMSTKGLSIRKVLEGHPYTVVAQREDDEAAEEEVKTPTADISIKLNKPSVTYMSEKKVQEKHGKEGIAGYTKPGINIGVSKLKKYEIKVVITLDFYMDLAKEYKGGRKQVLRDHEDGHILIAEKVAKEFVADPLKTDLEAMPEFNEGNKSEILEKFGDKLADFESEEGTASQDFDDIDYPRMEEAYYGVATSLADLASGSPQVKTMVEAMDAFNGGASAAAGDAEALGALTKAVVNAQGALGETNLARLQYNADFKKKVSKAQGIVAKLNKKPDKLAEGVKDKLDEVSPALEQFTWTPDIS